MFMSKRANVLNLKVVAALAEKLAMDLENNKLWEGDYEYRLHEIQRALDEASRKTNGID